MPPARFRGPFTVLLLRLLVLAIIYMVQRLIFWWVNAETFPSAPFAVFGGGVRFDLSAIGWLNMPWVLLFLVHPDPRGAFAVVQRLVFLLVNAVGFFFNSVDLAYFSFTLKRSTADLFGIATGGSDMAHLLPVFVLDYWWVVLVFSGSLVAAWQGYRWAGRRTNDGPRSILRRVLWRVATVALVLLLSRGGLQLIPMGVLDAAAYAPPAYMPLVLNSPFTILKSVGKPVVEAKDFMPQQEAERLWPVKHHYAANAMTTRQPNVVVIVLESFSAAYSAALSGRRDGCMPFLDSLMGQGLTFTRAYANGRRSIDGIPAIFAGMPKLMDEAFITSPYAATPFTSLASVLGGEGYHTTFFHAGHNGTMGFDAFTRSAGFQEYIGRNEYPVNSDDDLVWGIWDRPFFHYFAQELTKRPQPFLAGFFSLTSHHPYQLPKEEMARFKGGGHQIMPTLRYADDAMRDFFRMARATPWYGNTLFVITADHTADLERNGEQSGAAYDHWVPLVYYMPGVIQPRSDARTTQHIDIMPTVLDLVGCTTPFFAFGSSAVREERMHAATSESSATWLIVNDKAQLRTDGEHILWASGVGDSVVSKVVPVPSKAQLDSAQQVLRAAVQQFTGSLLRNELVLPKTP